MARLRRNQNVRRPGSGVRRLKQGTGVGSQRSRKSEVSQSNSKRRNRKTFEQEVTARTEVETGPHIIDFLTPYSVRRPESIRAGRQKRFHRKDAKNAKKFQELRNLACLALFAVKKFLLRQQDSDRLQCGERGGENTGSEIPRNLAHGSGRHKSRRQLHSGTVCCCDHLLFKSPRLEWSYQPAVGRDMA
jgi:hypothetical protein